MISDSPESRWRGSRDDGWRDTVRQSDEDAAVVRGIEAGHGEQDGRMEGRERWKEVGVGKVCWSVSWPI